jgi:hypothetical protein
MTHAAEEEEGDPVALAFPDEALRDQAHELIGQALCALVELGYRLDAAQEVLHEGLAAIVEDYEA